MAARDHPLDVNHGVPKITSRLHAVFKPDTIQHFVVIVEFPTVRGMFAYSFTFVVPPPQPLMVTHCEFVGCMFSVFATPWSMMQHDAPVSRRPRRLVCLFVVDERYRTVTSNESLSLSFEELFFHESTLNVLLLPLLSVIAPHLSVFASPVPWDDGEAVIFFVLRSYGCIANAGRICRKRIRICVWVP